MTRLLVALAALLLAATGGLPGPAEARTRALLVGVSDYPKDKVGDLQLAGPKFDVALMVETLRITGVADADMTVLADGLDQTGLDRAADGAPTRAAILDAFAALAAEAEPGDRVIVYLSGHGSQEPETRPDAAAKPEADGLNEIFLPIDIGTWSDTTGTVENALVDDEVGAAVSAIRAKGASVWLVVDACHSGTLTRGAAAAEDDDAVVRMVEPSVLGIPAAAMAAARGTGGLRSGAGGAARKDETVEVTAAEGAEGGFVAFYAAHPDQLALQRNLPKTLSKKVEKRPHGVLTFALAQALRSGRPATYRDLAYAVLAGYQAWGAQAPVPLFEGDLSEPLAGGAGGPRVYGVRVAEDGSATLDGGLADGLGAGAVLAIRQADKPDAPPLGYAVAGEPGMAEAPLQPVERDGAAAPDFAKIGRLRTLVATVEQPAVSFTFTVAAPSPGDDRHPAAKTLRAALDALAAAGGAGDLAFRIVPAGEEADISLAMAKGALFLVPDGAPLVAEGRDRTPSVPLAAFQDPAKAETRLKSVLTVLAKAKNLIRLADGVGASAVEGLVGVEPWLYRPEPLPQAADAKAPDDRPCASYPLDRLPDEAVSFADLSGEAVDALDLRHCDVVYFRLTATGGKPVDVTPLYVDGAGGIAYVGPAEGIRLEPGGAPQVVPVRVVTWSQKSDAPLPIGLERMIFVAVVQDDRDAVPADFRYLAQPAATAVASRGGGPGAFRSLLEQAAFGTGTDRSAAVAAPGTAGMAQFRWRVRVEGEGGS